MPVRKAGGKRENNRMLSRDMQWKAQNEIVDRPKMHLKLGSLLVLGGTGFLLYKSIMVPSLSGWQEAGPCAIFALSCYAVVREFRLRPTRRTTIDADRHQVIVRESAAWRERELAGTVASGDRFEVYTCDHETGSRGVRIKTAERKWLVIAEYLRKEDAEWLMRKANVKLTGR